MNESDFTGSMVGVFVRNLAGAITFRPDALPPRLPAWPMAMARQLSEVDTLLGRLDGTAKALPDRRILVRSFVRREAQLSSYIENTYARYEDVADVDASGVTADVPDPVRETWNAERAISAGVEAVFERGRSVDLGLIRLLHEVLLTGVRGHGSRGKFRDIQVYIGRSRNVDDARFVPPPAHLLPELMDDFDTFLQTPDELPPLVRLALIHYQFEALHPFEDGNGRLGRILILLGLCQHKVLTVPVFNASLHFERHREHYYDSLLRVSTHGDWTQWISFFLEALRVAAVESMQKLDELLALRSNYHERVQAARNSSLLSRLVDELFIRPTLRISDAAQVMGVTYPAAQRSLEKLLRAGILAEVRPPATPKRFVARGILRAVRAEPSRH